MQLHLLAQCIMRATTRSCIIHACDHMRLISPVSLQQTLTDTDTAATYSFRWRPHSDDRVVPRNQYVLQTYSMSRCLCPFFVEPIEQRAYSAASLKWHGVFCFFSSIRKSSRS